MDYTTPQTQPRNGIGTAALTLGIIGLVLAFIPVIGFIGFVLGILALIFGIVGAVRSRKGQATNSVASWTGFGLGVAAIVISIVVFISFLAGIGKSLQNFENPTYTPPSGQQPNGNVSGSDTTGLVRYEVDGNGTAGNISYGANGTTQQNNRAQLPWRAEEAGNGRFSVYSLVAQNGGGGEISCRISVDGEVVDEATSKGEYAVASCNGSSGR